MKTGDLLLENKTGLERGCIKLEKESKVSRRTTKQIIAISKICPSLGHTDSMSCAMMIVGSQLAKEPVTAGEAQKAVFLSTEMGPHHNRHEINQKIRLIYRKLGIRIAPTDPVDYINRFCKKTGLDKEIAKTAKAIIANSELTGILPPAIAAAGIKIATRGSDQEITQQKMAEITGISEVTIRTITGALEKQIEK